MESNKRSLFPTFQLADRNGNGVSVQVSKSGGAVNLATGLLDNEGFYVSVAPAGTEGLLKVVLMNGDFASPVVLPFYKGFDKNPVLIKQIVVDAGNTAVGVYWAK